MGVGELIEQIRSLYLATLRKALMAQPAGTLEPVVTSAVAEGIQQSLSTLPSRHDGMTVDAAGRAQPVVVESEGVLGFEDITFDWGDDLKVCLTPFCWDFAEFEVPNVGTKDLSGNLVDWFERWFMPSGSSALGNITPAVEGELAGVVHALSELHSDGVNSRFQVDFGSAPLACFEDLLDALAASKARSVVVREAV